MLELFALWALIEGLGLCCLPLTFTVFHNLPDRGWAFSKTLGLAVFAFSVWLPLMLVPVLPFSRPFIAGVLFLLLALSILGFVRCYRDILDFIRRQSGYVLLAELIFLGMVCLLGWLRSFGPDIYGFEMFMDEGFVASIMRSPHFPPNDMWYAGQSINYYYYAHYTMALAGKLLGRSTSIIFNTGICIFFGLCASNLFGVTCNIVTWARALRQRVQGFSEIKLPSLLPAIPYGLFSFLMALMFGNLASTSQWWKLHDTTDLYGRWFGPTRVIKLEVVQNGVTMLVDATISEFPAFSFLLSCFHAHVLALAFTILAMGVAFNLFLAQGKGLSAFGDGWQRVLTLVCSALIIGGLFIMNGWDYPTYLLLALVCLACQQWLAHNSRFSFPFLVDLLLPAIGMALLSFVLFLPFYLNFISPSQGIGLVSPTMRSMLGDELLIFGVFIFLFLSLLLASVLQRPLPGRFSAQTSQPEAQWPVAVSAGSASDSGAVGFDLPVAANASQNDPPQKSQSLPAREELSLAYASSEEESEHYEGDESLSWPARILFPLCALAYLMLCLVFLKFVPDSATLVVGSSFALFGVLLMLYHLRNRAHAFTLLLGTTAFALVAFC